VRDIHLVLLRIDPKWDPYRSDPRFESLQVRCGFTASFVESPGGEERIRASCFGFLRSKPTEDRTDRKNALFDGEEGVGIGHLLAPRIR
jgi:hypothetical protein